MKIKVIALIFFGLILFGCITQDNPTDLNSSLKNDLIDSNIPFNEEGIFCQMNEEYKFYYEENYYSIDLIPGVTTQFYQKQTLSELKYFEKLKDDPGGVGTWGVATKNDFVVYSNADGECVAMRHGASVNPFLMKEPIYYDVNFTGELKQIGGSEFGWKLRQRENLGEDFDTEIITLSDYISKEYCIPLVQDINSFDYSSHSEKVNFTRIFDESVFEIPVECKNAPMIDLTNIDYNYRGQDYYKYNDGEHSESSYDEGTQEGYDIDDGYSDECIAQCEKMREICQVDGLEVTPDGQGCYDPSTQNYQRNCEYVCWSN